MYGNYQQPQQVNNAYDEYQRRMATQLALLNPQGQGNGGMQHQLGTGALGKFFTWLGEESEEDKKKRLQETEDYAALNSPDIQQFRNGI